MEIKIENVVASCNLNTRMPLDKIASSLENTEYEPEQFPGLVYRIDEPKAAALIFGSGNIVCTGTRSVEEAKRAVKKIVDELKSIGIEIEDEVEIDVQNIVASSHLNTTLNLNKIAFELINTEYEPEQFPGLVYRLDNPKLAFLIFSSGKIVCTGGRTFENVAEGIEKMKKNLREIGEYKGE
jgi:transcription initiation factor TFIID TATA-box-binding protein